MEIACLTCRLRPLAPSDANALARHANNRRIAENLRDRFPHPYHVTDAEAFITQVAGQPVPTTFGIEVHGEIVGTIGLIVGTDIERCSAEVGYWIGEPFWGRGIVPDALHAVTSYGFTTLDLARVFAVAFTTTTRSVRVLEKAGFVREGLMRQSAIKDGIVRDQWLYARYRDTSAFAERPGA
jgi:[ribosomal protein S5]-alanine N-acetyltransferase